MRPGLQILRVVVPSGGIVVMSADQTTGRRLLGNHDFFQEPLTHSHNCEALIFGQKTHIRKQEGFKKAGVRVQMKYSGGSVMGAE